MTTLRYSLQNKQFVILVKISSKTAFENFKNFISFHETFKTKFSTHISSSDTLESFLSKVTFESEFREILHDVSWKLSQFFFFQNKLSRLEHVLFLQVSFASYFWKRLSKELSIVCHYLYGMIV